MGYAIVNETAEQQAIESNSRELLRGRTTHSSEERKFLRQNDAQVARTVGS